MNGEIAKLSALLLQLGFSQTETLRTTLLLLTNQALLLDLVYSVFATDAALASFLARNLPGTERITLMYNIVQQQMRFRPLVPIEQFCHYEHYHNVKTVRVLAKFVLQLGQYHQRSSLPFDSFMNASFRWQHWERRIEVAPPCCIAPWTPEVLYAPPPALCCEARAPQERRRKRAGSPDRKRHRREDAQRAELRLQRKYGRATDCTASTVSQQEGHCRTEQAIEGVDF
ncbi:hypothetical protein SS50377_26235 [Spironucleus salmonicida]|uniref:Uncharacterized protein n=1 Tax=Spironucleus salmonicida TaxID=348837 RepID=A0A9P8LPS8_9EUKA|nr:hypothetical protein SS50377_26235 [Spironucleus salmonicida]